MVTPNAKMTKYSLIKELNQIKDMSKSHKEKVSKTVLADENLFKSLVEIAFDYNNETSVKAAQVLEVVCEERLDWIAYNLPYFTKNIAYLKNDNAVRPAAKICNLIAKEINSKFDSPIKVIATKEQIAQIIETCLAWLLDEDTKVVSKAHAMEALYHLGHKLNWIHYELKMIIERDIEDESPAYTVRASKILQKLAKENRA